MGLTHFDESGRARMVDVSAKAETMREATAAGAVRMRGETLALIRQGAIAKGDVLAVAQVAGVMAAKQTPQMIPMCHTLLLTGVDLAFTLDDGNDGNDGKNGVASVTITATVRTVGKTGAEMEALAAVSVAALTIYDMCKAVDRAMVIDQVRLLRKSGGKSGDFVRDDAAPYEHEENENENEDEDEDEDENEDEGAGSGQP
jgi:cyclic pyranopterin monophosphate synthase